MVPVDQSLNPSRSRQITAMFWTLLGQAGPAFLQLIYVVVAARVLGADTAGIFFLIVSVAVVGSCFVGLGGGGTVMRQVARDASAAPIAFGRAEAMSYATFPAVLPIVAAVAWYITNRGAVPLWLIFAVSSADLLAARILTTSWSLFVALEEHVRASLLVCTMPFARLCAVAMTACWPADERLIVLAVLYSISSFAVLFFALIYVRSRIGSYPLSLSGFAHSEGVSYSITWFSAALQSESDKLLLGIYSAPAVVAVFAIASRLMDGAAMPVRAIRVAMLKKLFRAGAAGHHKSMQLTLRILPFSVGYGVVAWIAVSVLAPDITKAFGSDYSAMVHILPALGVLPLLRAVSDHGAEVFTTSNRPAVQAFMQIVGTVLRVGLGVVLIGTFELQGAVVTAVSINAILALAFWGLAWKLSRNQKPFAPP